MEEQIKISGSESKKSKWRLWLIIILLLLVIGIGIYSFVFKGNSFENFVERGEILIPKPLDNSYYSQLAILQARAGFCEKAKESSEKTKHGSSNINCDSSSTPDSFYYRSLGELNLKYNRLNGAIENFEKALEIEEIGEYRKRVIRLYLVEIYFKKGDYDKSIETYESILKEAKEPWLRHRTAESMWEVCENSGREDKILKKYQNIFEENSDDLISLNVLLAYYSGFEGSTNEGEPIWRDLDKAIELCKKLLEKTPEDVYLLAEYGNLLLKNKNLGEAESVFEKLLILEPRNSEQYYPRITDAYHSAGNCEKTLEWAERYAQYELERTENQEYSRELMSALSYYGNKCIYCGEYERAIDIFEQAIALDKGAVFDKSYAKQQLREAQAKLSNLK